jgi:predicted kinase
MQTEKPVLLLMAGLPGTGKSTLALAVGQRLAWPVLDKDTVKSSLLDVGADEELAGQASYTLLYELARDLVVGQGLSVILDTPSSYERVIKASTQIVAEGNGVLQVVLCEATLETRAERLAKRERRSSHVIAIDEAADAAISPVFEKLPESTLRLSTEAPADDLVDHVVAVILGVKSAKD